MGFGLFKKIKDAAKKFLPKMSGIMKKIAPVVKTITQEAPKYVTNEKVKNYLNTADEIFDVANVVVGIKLSVAAYDVVNSIFCKLL